MLQRVPLPFTVTVGKVAASARAATFSTGEGVANTVDSAAANAASVVCVFMLSEGSLNPV